MNTRIQQLISRFSYSNIDAFLVTHDVNIRYLTEFPASESWLLISPFKSFYITDFRYILEAQKGLQGITIKRYTKSLHAGVFEAAQHLKVKRLGFDDRHISLASFKQLKKECPKGIQLIPMKNFVEDLREIKSFYEISQIRKALTLHQEAYQLIKKEVKPGLTEREIFNTLESFVKSKNAGFSFPPIIASGPNSCFPHARVTSRKIRSNEPVLIDMGIDINGYKSDLTRMILLGKIHHFVGEVYDFVRQAQALAIKYIQPGRRAGEVDHQARNYLTKNRLGKFFGHSLGHGVGLEIHENPRISQSSPTILKEGMIFTVEPAVYIPNKFGIRIEDMVLVTKQGCEVISEHIHQ